MVDRFYALIENANTVFLQPLRVLFVPNRFETIGEHEHARRIREHAKRVFDGVIVGADDTNFFTLHTKAVAVLAEKHAVTEATIQFWNRRRDVKNSCRQ